MTKVTAQLNNLRIAPRKVRLVADRVRGVQVDKAIGLLQYDLRKTAGPLQKLLKSAVSNAQNDFKLKSEDLYIVDMTVGEGPTLKRWTPRAYGRASKILKRTSRVRVVLSEKSSKNTDNQPVKDKKKDDEKDVKSNSQEKKSSKDKVVADKSK